jgi:hypothetical protein
MYRYVFNHPLIVSDATGLDIYYLLDAQAIWSFGHAGLLFTPVDVGAPDGLYINGCVYASFFNWGLECEEYRTLGDALNAPELARYTHQIKYPLTKPATQAAMQATVLRYWMQTYNAATNNCDSLAGYGLTQGNVPFRLGSHPVETYIINEKLSSLLGGGGGPWPTKGPPPTGIPMRMSTTSLKDHW